MQDTLIIMTGGTIDAEPYPDPNNPPKNAIPLENSVIPSTIASMGYGGRCDFFKWTAKDSKAFTSEEMDALAQIIRTSPAKNIIITHGTDAMPEHSRQILGRLSRVDTAVPNGHVAIHGKRKNKADIDKRVIFTGAMMPIANGPESDGYKNLGYIFRNMDKWQAGVRVVMHEKSFDPVGLSKNFETFRFHGREIIYEPPSLVSVS